MKNFVIILLIVLAGAGFWYQKIHLPNQEKMLEMQRELAKMKEEEEAAAKEAEKKVEVAVVEEEEKKAAVEEPPAETVVEEPKMVEAEAKPEEEKTETGGYSSKVEERDVRLSELRDQLTEKKAEFERRRLELQNRKTDFQQNYNQVLGAADDAVRDAENKLRTMRNQLTSGGVRKSASDQQKILAPLEAAVTQAKANKESVYQDLKRQEAELDKEWNQYFSDREIMETNYRSAVNKVIDETR